MASRKLVRSLLCLLLSLPAITYPALQHDSPPVDLAKVHAAHRHVFDQRTFRGSLAEKADRDGSAGFRVQLGLSFFSNGGSATFEGWLGQATCSSDAVLI